MSTFDYTSIRDSVVETQVAYFGMDATLTEPGAPTGPAWDPTPGTPTSYSVKVVRSRFTVADRASSVVQEDDLVFLMSTTNDPAPTLKGTLTVNSVVYQIIKVEPVQPGATVVAWRVYVRK